MWHILITLTVLLSACGLLPKPHRVADTINPIDDLIQMHDLYSELSREGVRDQYGFVEAHECDSLLFSALHSVGRGQEIDIHAAEISPGQWYRNPSKAGCSSTISRDMLVGLIWYAWHYKDREIVEDLWTYGSKNNWKMGSGSDAEKDARTVMTPSLVSLLAQVRHHLGGESDPAENIPVIYSLEPGFTTHLSVLEILLVGEMHQGLDEGTFAVLRQLAEANPGNPLIQAVYHRFLDGEQSVAIRLLLEEWPQDRLPRTDDWCDAWRTQRAAGEPSLAPCPSYNHVWSGGDALFAAAVILGRI